MVAYSCDVCARAKLSLVVAWSARGQHVCISVEEITGLRSPHARVIPHGALWFDWVCAKCIAGFRDKNVYDGIYTETLQLRGKE